MPLDEREQQILDEIEKSLYHEDPGFARQVKKAAPNSREFRNVKLGSALFLLGLVLLVAFFVSQLLLVGVVAFGAMVAGIVLAAGATGNLIGAQRRSAQQPQLRERIAGSFRDWERKLRERYRRR